MAVGIVLFVKFFGFNNIAWYQAARNGAEPEAAAQYPADRGDP
jgi:hypothetical protein